MTIATPPDAASLDALCAAAEASALEVRRHLHEDPELSWKEHRTQAFLKDYLVGLGLEPREAAETGLYADIGEGDAPVLYRADIDALPIQEARDPGHAACVSKNPGVAHACGHDLHSGVAAGLARVFRDLHQQGALPGRVRIVFQPAEEVVPSGGAAIVREGVAQGMRAAFALHADPMRDVGTVGLRVGTLTASSDKYALRIKGHAGHSSRPYLARDPILASADVIRALHGLVRERVDPLKPAVIAVCTIAGGQAENVIPEQVEMVGTLRTFHPDVRELLYEEMARVATAAAAVHGCSAEIVFHHGAPSIHNAPALHLLMEQAARDALGPDGVAAIEQPSSGAEDFSQFGRYGPIYMMRLGVRTPGEPSHHLHTPEFEVDERAALHAMRVMSRSVLRALEHDPAELAV